MNKQQTEEKIVMTITITHCPKDGGVDVEFEGHGKGTKIMREMADAIAKQFGTIIKGFAEQKEGLAINLTDSN